MTEYSDAEREFLIQQIRETLSRDPVVEARQVSAPERMSPEERDRLVREAPTPSHHELAGREYDKRMAQRAAERDAIAEVKRLIAAETEAIYRSVSTVFAKFCAPYLKRVAELEERINNMRHGRDGVSVTACSINRSGELQIILSDGTVMTPGKVTAKANDRVEPGEVIDLPPVLEAKRGWRS